MRSGRFSGPALTMRPHHEPWPAHGPASRRVFSRPGPVTDTRRVHAHGRATRASLQGSGPRTPHQWPAPAHGRAAGHPRPAGVDGPRRHTHLGQDQHCREEADDRTEPGGLGLRVVQGDRPVAGTATTASGQPHDRITAHVRTTTSRAAESVSASGALSVQAFPGGTAADDEAATVEWASPPVQVGFGAVLPTQRRPPGGGTYHGGHRHGADSGQCGTHISGRPARCEPLHRPFARGGVILIGAPNLNRSHRTPRYHREYPHTAQ